MNKTISEQALETAIVADLTKAHYVQREPSAFDKTLCLDPGPLIDFVEATQPKEWAKFVATSGRRRARLSKAGRRGNRGRRHCTVLRKA